MLPLVPSTSNESEAERTAANNITGGASTHRSRPVRSISEYPGVMDLGMDGMDGSLARLYEIAWGKGSAEDLFRPFFVERDKDNLNTEAPRHTIGLHWDTGCSNSEGLLADINASSILIRDEYWKILQGIINKSVLERQQENIVDGDKKSDRVMNLGSEIHSLRNPFTDPQLSQALTEDLGTIVAGSPGIGKSAFLIYVLALRLLARRTTVFQKDDNHCFVFSNDGVFRIHSPVDRSGNLYLYLPDETWFLVDSTADSTGVPWAFIQTCYVRLSFILQVLPQRGDCCHWADKIDGNIPIKWMAPWSLEELILGRDFQWWENEANRPTEQQLASFTKHFGTSAREAYKHAADPREYAERLHHKLSGLTMKRFKDLLDRAIWEEPDKDIFVQVPVPGQRLLCTVQIHSKYLFKEILKSLSRHDKHVISTLYQALMETGPTRPNLHYFSKRQRIFLRKFPEDCEVPLGAMNSDKASEKSLTTNSFGTLLTGFCSGLSLTHHVLPT